MQKFLHRTLNGTYFLIPILLALGMNGHEQLYALGPTAVMGMYSEYTVESEDQEIEGFADIGVQGFISYRKFLAHGGYAAGSASISVSGLLPGTKGNDIEYASFLVSVPAADNRLEISSHVTSSLFSDNVFIQPEWKLLYRMERGRREIRPYAAHNGYYLYQEDGTDRSYWGGEIGIVHSPKVELAYQAAFKAGVENWLQQSRSDFLGDMRIDIQGLMGYFINWEAAGEIQYRASSDESMSSIAGTIAGELGWSPSRRMTLSVRPAVKQKYMIQDNDIDTSISSVFRIDYTTTDTVYLYAENNLAVMNPFGQDSHGWKMRFTGGIDISL